MPKPGIIKLPCKLFPNLKDTYTDKELKHMLVISCSDINGTGLKMLHTLPNLIPNDEVLSTKPVVTLLYPIVKTAMEKEYIHGKLVCLLNTSEGTEKMDYMITTVFIGDDKDENLKLADVFMGEPETGSWALPDQIKQFADALNVAVYTTGDGR